MSRLFLPEKPKLIRNSGPVVIAPKPAKLVMKPGTVDRVRGLRERLQFAEWQRRFKQMWGVAPVGGGAAGAWTFTSAGLTNILSGEWAIGTDSFKAGLASSSSNLGSSSDNYSSLTGELSTAHGYTEAGISATLSLSGTTTVTVAFTQAQWTASGGDIAARYVFIYEVGGKILAYALCDSTPADVTAVDGNTFTLSAGNVASLTTA